MSVKIRLTRTGKSHQISYRIAALDTRSKRDGKIIENLGFYNPYNTPSFKIDKERYDYWIKTGAQPSPSVAKLVVDGKLIYESKRAKQRAKDTLTKKEEIAEVKQEATPPQPAEDKKTEETIAPAAEEKAPEPKETQEPNNPTIQ